MKQPDLIHNPGLYWEALLKPIMKEAGYRKKGRTPRSVENIIRPDYLVGKSDGTSVYNDPVN